MSHLMRRPVQRPRVAWHTATMLPLCPKPHLELGSRIPMWEPNVCFRHRFLPPPFSQALQRFPPPGLGRRALSSALLCPFPEGPDLEVTLCPLRLALASGSS